jgi:hypothetical protein
MSVEFNPVQAISEASEASLGRRWGWGPNAT